MLAPLLLLVFLDPLGSETLVAQLVVLAPAAVLKLLLATVPRFSRQTSEPEASSPTQIQKPTPNNPVPAPAQSSGCGKHSAPMHHGVSAAPLALLIHLALLRAAFSPTHPGSPLQQVLLGLPWQLTS